MGISIKGYTPDFKFWVFDIDGREFAAENNSSPDPLTIKFVRGRYMIFPLSYVPNNSGFGIISSTTTKTNQIGEKSGMVEWYWQGTPYRSPWQVIAEEVIVQPNPAEGEVGEYNYTLEFVKSGATGSYAPPAATTPPVQQPTTPVQQPTPPVQQPTAADNQVIELLKRELAEVNRSLAVSENQRMIDLNELNKARVNAEGLQINLNDARAELSQAGVAQLAALQAQLNESVQRLQEQYKTSIKDQALINDLTRDLAQANANLKAAEQSSAINVAQLNQAKASAQNALTALEDAKVSLSSGYNTMLLKLQGEIADALVRVQTNYQRALKAEEEKARIAADLARTQGERDEANLKLAEQQRLANERRKAEADTEALKKASDTVKTEAAKGQGSIVPVVLGIGYLLLS